MHTSKYEYLSSVFDDEAGKFEQHRILDEVQRHEPMRAKLASYALMREVMQEGKPEVVVKSDFLARLHERIESEGETHNAEELWYK